MRCSRTVMFVFVKLTSKAVWTSLLWSDEDGHLDCETLMLISAPIPDFDTLILPALQNMQCLRLADVCAGILPCRYACTTSPSQSRSMQKL